jgi:NADPH:quinone reductase-like Zn-dependent oxidoreductase
MSSITLSGGASWTDPAGCADAAWTARYHPERLTKEQAMALTEAVSTLHHILYHPAGTESVVRQVREARRVIRQRGQP